MADRVTDEDRELLGELGVEITPEATGGRTPREQRIIAGFEEIERFFDEHGRAPEHGDDRDIFERLYAVRLDRLRALPECREVLVGLDRHGLLSGGSIEAATTAGDELDDAALLESLGVDNAAGNDVTQIRHVRTRQERKAAEDVAQRRPCEDFELFRPTFERVQRELDAGARHTTAFEHNGKLDPGDLFILGGQKVLIASAAESIEKVYGREDRRLRVIFDNGTESNLWLRSLQRGLYKDGRNRRILPAEANRIPLLAGRLDDGDIQSGSIYVVRSQSDHPFVVANRKLIHKIGVTGGDVNARLAAASKDPTYLLAGVDLVAEYRLANVNRKALEAMLHQVLSPARLDLELQDRFGSQVQPREWFFVPLSCVDELVNRIRDGSIAKLRYDLGTAGFVPIDHADKDEPR